MPYVFISNLGGYYWNQKSKLNKWEKIDPCCLLFSRMLLWTLNLFLLFLSALSRSAWVTCLLCVFWLLSLPAASFSFKKLTPFREWSRFCNFSNRKSKFLIFLVEYLSPIIDSSLSLSSVLSILEIASPSALKFWTLLILSYVKFRFCCGLN